MRWKMNGYTAWLVCAAVAAGLGVCGEARAQESLRAQQVAQGLAQPVGIVTVPGAGNDKLAIVEQGGTIKLLELSTTTPTLSANFLNIGQSAPNAADRLTLASGERGLLGFAFDPDYLTNGRVYVNYTTASSSPLRTRIDRFTVVGDPATATSVNTASRITMIEYVQDFNNHNGGDIEFGPDGMLYVGSGDGGNANDPNQRAQATSTFLGKILRLDPNDSADFGVDGDGPWVPDDNPFRVAGIAAVPAHYFWAIGMRNPWRLHFDRVTGDLYIGDVGQDAQEEIDFQSAYIPGPGGNGAQVAGRNYGWDCREGLVVPPSNPVLGCDPNAVGVYTDPVKVYLHNGDGACSVTGGVVYRGSAFPDLVGHYFHADYCGQWVKSFKMAGGVATDQRDWTGELNQSGTTVFGVVAWGLDKAGEMYFASINTGRIYKITDGCACPCFDTDSELVFSDGFEIDRGWTRQTSAETASDGFWQRGQPVASPSYPWDPVGDSNGDGWAMVTENSDPGGGSTSDVDGPAGAAGQTVIMSPNLDFTGGDISVCFDYFLGLNEENLGNTDGLYVEISSNGTAGPWTSVRSITLTTRGQWRSAVIEPSQLASAGVTNTATMRARFIARDNLAPNASIVEAAIDNFRVYRRVELVDCNQNGIADAIDISMGTSADCNDNDIPDECDIHESFLAAQMAGNPDLRLDLDGGPVGDRMAGATFFNANCIGCHAANGTGGTGPNIRNKDRHVIRRRLYALDFHPGGIFPESTAQEHANIEAFLSDLGGTGRADNIIDACQIGLADCDGDMVSDGRELELQTQLDRNFNGEPDSCECLCDWDGNGVVEGTDIFVYLDVWFANNGRDRLVPPVSA